MFLMEDLEERRQALGDTPCDVDVHDYVGFESTVELMAQLLPLQSLQVVLLLGLWEMSF